MVKIDRKEGLINISTSGDISDLVGMQSAIADLMKNFNFKEFGNGARDTFYFGLMLLQALTPDEDQQKKGLTESK